jgi:hypothetical protein
MIEQRKRGKMNLNKFNSINEAIKNFISGYQQSRILDTKKLKKLHDELLETVAIHRTDLALYEDILVKMEECIGRINKGQLGFLVGTEKQDYHYLLWVLHQKIISKEKHLKIRELPKYLRKLNKTLKSAKYFFKTEKGYLISARIGDALGHFTSMTIEENRLLIEYSDHSPSRTRMLQRRMIKKDFGYSPISVLKDIFARRDEGSNNYLFNCWKTYDEQQDLEKDLLYFGKSLSLLIDTDWLILDSKSEITEEEIENETKILEMAFMLYDLFELKPKNFTEMLLTLIRANCGV